MRGRTWKLPAIALTGVVAAAGLGYSDTLAKQIELPGDRVYPESIAAAPDGTLYVSSLASGGIARVRPGSARAEPWIAPGAFGTRSTFGVFVDERSKLLLVCSNDASGMGVPGPGTVSGSYLKAFDLASGEGRLSVPLPGSKNLCNDMTTAPDGSVYVTNSLAPQILKLAPGSKEFEVWLQDDQFTPPKDGAGLDGIVMGSDGNIYVNTFAKGEFFRVDVHDGHAGKVTRLDTSRPLQFPDGLRAFGGNVFLMAEGAGTLDRVTVGQGHKVTIVTLRDGLAGPTAVAKVGDTAWVAEGQLPHLFDAAKNGPPQLPFHIASVPLGHWAD